MYVHTHRRGLPGHKQVSRKTVSLFAVAGLLACMGITGFSSDAAADYQLVYTRQPYASTPIPGVPGSEHANWQHATDVARINSGGIAEADVVIDDLNGDVKILFDCTGSEINCVAQEARVSPDGRRIAYSVAFGSPGAAGRRIPTSGEGTRLSLSEIPVIRCAQIYIYNIVTRTNVAVPNHPGGDCETIYPRDADGAIDRQPEWLDNQTLVFSSNRGNTYPFKTQAPVHQGEGRCTNWPYCVYQEYGYGHAGKSMQIWTMRVDGTQKKNISPHEQMALSPAVMSNGDILYSCWNAHGNKGHDSRTAIGPATTQNKWWLCRVDGNGADQTVILNGHKSTYIKTSAWLPQGFTGGEGVTRLRALRSAAEIFPGKLAVTNYYRGNHVGSMGIIFGMDYKDPHVEGCSTAACYDGNGSSSTVPGTGQYVPSSIKAITPFGQDQDTRVRFKFGMAAGKAGYAAPYSDTEFLITYGAGQCFSPTRDYEANTTTTGGAPTCWKSIYKVKVPMVTDPFDLNQMEPLAGGLEFQSWDARPIKTYQEMFGKAAPDRPEPLDPDAGCYLQVVDVRASELHPAEPYDWRATKYAHCAHQGCAIKPEKPNYYKKKVERFAVLIPEMWDISYSGANKDIFATTLNTIGHKSIGTYRKQKLQPDGSVRMQVPCETPLIMVGQDGDGATLAHDEMLHSLRAGETRTCHGCHDGHSEERARELKHSPAERFADTMAANYNSKLGKRKKPTTFEKIRPILVKRCGQCHEGFEDDELLHSRIVYDFEQIDFPWLDRKLGQTDSSTTPYNLARPYTSWWVSKFALDSPLYWYARNERTDGYSNKKFDNDIDFHEPHESNVTKKEARLIARWIDQGAQN